MLSKRTNSIKEIKQELKQARQLKQALKLEIKEKEQELKDARKLKRTQALKRIQQEAKERAERCKIENKLLATDITQITVLIGLQNTTGREDINQLVNFCFESLSNILTVDSFKQKNHPGSERAKELRIKLNLTWIKSDNDINNALRKIENAISKHWQCKFNSFGDDVPERFRSYKTTINLLPVDSSSYSINFFPTIYARNPRQTYKPLKEQFSVSSSDDMNSSSARSFKLNT